MSRLRCRGPIALAAVAVALSWSSPADAQVGFDPGPPREPGGLLNNVATGALYDIANRAKAEHQLDYRLTKLDRDAQRGDADAVNFDKRRIANLKFRIVVDGWLIRQNTLYNPGCYPYPVRLDVLSCEAITQAGCCRR